MKISFIIPVYGQWDLTKQCLESLKKEVLLPFEVILVNNGYKAINNDETDKYAISLGKKLFDDNFVYLPQEENINFAAASNLGAKNAKGDILFFLNNDTIVIKGFLEPLVQSIDEDNSLKIVAPLLLYPKNSFGIHTIQHMGIAFTPTKKLIHVYEDFPENHRVTRRKKPLQAVTAAAFMIKKKDFETLSGFNEDFRNGFEDIELCGRFNKMGGSYEVITQSHVLHYCSQSQGRNDFDIYNANLLNTLGTAENFKPDWHTLLESDGYELKLNKWLSFIPSLSEKHSKSLEKYIINNDLETLKKEFHKESYWQEGLIAIVNHKEANFDEKWRYFEFGQKFNKDLIYEDLDIINNDTRNIVSYILEQEQFKEDYPTIRLNKLQNLQLLLKPISTSLYLQCTKLIDTHDDFINNEYKEIKDRLMSYL